jgi:hypothetical protein
MWKEWIKRSTEQIQDLNDVPEIEKRSEIHQLRRVIAGAVHKVIIEEAGTVLPPDDIEDAVIKGSELSTRKRRS